MFHEIVGAAMGPCAALAMAIAAATSVFNRCGELVLSGRHTYTLKQS